MSQNEKCGEKLLLLIYINIQRPNKLVLIIFRPPGPLLNANLFIGKFSENIAPLYYFSGQGWEVLEFQKINLQNIFQVE